jgi:hypothetical protein
MSKASPTFTLLVGAAELEALDAELEPAAVEDELVLEEPLDPHAASATRAAAANATLEATRAPPRICGRQGRIDTAGSFETGEEASP